MTPRQTGWWAGLALLLAAMLTNGAVAAQTNVRFALNSTFEGPSAPFLLSLDKGYFRAEGLNVTIEPGVDSLEAIKRWHRAITKSVSPTSMR